MSDATPGAARPGPRLQLLILSGLILFGGFIRLVDLDRGTLFGDELDHLYAARALNEGEGPLLPSGQAYERGLVYTRMVAATVSRFEDPELAARLPSAIFGCLGLVVFAAVAWKLIGAWAAVWAVLLLTLHPEAIVQSRQARFYTLQQTLAILALFAAWRTVLPAGSPPEKREPLHRTWLWAGVAAAALIAALTVQVTTLSVVVAWWAALAVAAAADLIRFGAGVWRRSAPVGICAAAFMIGILLLVSEIARGMPLLDRATFVPAWAGGRPGDARAYFWALEAAFPALMTLLPLHFLLVGLRRSFLLATFLGLWMCGPFLVHSFLLPWKGERYILPAVPALFLAGGVAAAVLFGALNRALDQWRSLAREQGHPVVPRWIASAAIVLIALFAVVTTPAARSVLDHTEGRDFRWPEVRAALSATPGADSLRFGSSMGLPALFYVGRVDFVVGSDFKEGALRPGAPQRGRAATPPSARPEGGKAEPDLDWYSGAPVLTTPEEIAAYFGPGRTVAIAIDGSRWRFGNIDPALKAVLTAEATELCHGRCGDVTLHLWTSPSTDTLSDEGLGSQAVGGGGGAGGLAP